MREGSVAGGKEAIDEKGACRGEWRPVPRVPHLLHQQNLHSLDDILTAPILQLDKSVTNNKLASIEGLQGTVSLRKPVRVKNNSKC